MTWLRDNPDVLEAFRRGERAALASVYEQYVRLVEIVARRGFVSGDARVPGASQEDEVHDLVQECFIRAFSERARLAYDGSRPYRPYLLQILRNLMIDRARKRGRAPVLVPHEPVDLDGLTEGEVLGGMAMPAPDDAAYWSELREAYREFEQELEDEEAAFIGLRYVEELPQRKVAESMDVTRRHVRTLEERVREKLRSFLKKKGL